MKFRYLFKRTLVIFTVFSFMFRISANNEVPMKWEVTHHNKKTEIGNDWFPAEVPGAVQLDYAREHNWGSYYYAENWKDYRWMEDSYWTYRTFFSKPDMTDGQQLWFISNGIDYAFKIRINGKQIHEQEGMFRPVRLNITNDLQDENELQITIFPVPKIPGVPETRDQAAQSVKPAVSYGWDWHPRLIPLGIWDDTYIEVRPAHSLDKVLIKYKLTDDLSKAQIGIHPIGNLIQGKKYKWELRNPDDNLVLEDDGIIEDLSNRRLDLDKPDLWWPHDHGKQPLYTSIFSILAQDGKILDQYSQKIGFRKIKLVMNPGTWEEPGEFPKGRSKAPMTIQINGKEIFGKGTNWVNPEIFPGTIDENRYEELIDRAIEANFNILRVWGGGIVNKESYYELCDQKGIMVWTDFPLACNNYEGTETYLSVLYEEAESIIKRISQHPSNVLWCGGNELFNSWSKMTDQSKALRLLNSLCYQLDPETPFIATSPIFGMGHGHYVFRDFKTKEEVFQWMPRARKTALTEFGMPGPASVEILKEIIPEDELFPPRRGTSWESHHAFNAWQGDTWLQKELLVDYFGTLKNLEEMVENGQWLQSEGVKCIYEEARRQKPYCSMALNWCFNEPWPTAANNSLISYPNKPKPAFYAVSQSCRPVLASARIPKFQWKEGDMFSCDLFILNDRYEEIPKGKMKVFLISGNQKIEILSWDYGKVQMNSNLTGPSPRYELPRFSSNKISLHLEVQGKPEWNSVYHLQYSVKEKKTVEKTPTLNQ